MNKQKQVPNVKLQKSSVIFMQLGLILSLFIVYMVLEIKTYYKPYKFAISNTIEEQNETTIDDFIIEKTQSKNNKSNNKVVKVVKREPKSIDKIETIKDDNLKKIETTVFKDTEDDQKDEVKIEKITDADIQQVDPDEVPEEEIPFSMIEKAPEFPGCKGTDTEKKQCFSDKVKKIVMRKFNVDLAQELGLSEGKKRISVQFIIDKDGNVTDIVARGPHKRLEKEAKRVIKLLPKMIPAQQGKNNVNVRFNLPINFIVED